MLLLLVMFKLLPKLYGEDRADTVEEHVVVAVLCFILVFRFKRFTEFSASSTGLANKVTWDYIVAYALSGAVTVTAAGKAEFDAGRIAYKYAGAVGVIFKKCRLDWNDEVDIYILENVRSNNNSRNI